MRINDILSNLKGLQSKWSGFLLNPRVVRRGNEITWESFDGRRFADVLYADDVVLLAEARQYSFQCADGSLFQFYYAFDRTGRHLSAAGLTFIQVPGDIAIVGPNLEEADDEGELGQDLEAVSPLPAAWVRVDFAPRDVCGCIHGACHMHVSLSPHVRIPVVGVPSPEQFVEAVTAWFYPSEYQARLLDDDGHFKDVDRIIEVNCGAIEAEINIESMQILHLNLPNQQHGPKLRGALGGK